MHDLPGDTVSVTAAPTPVDATAQELCDAVALAVEAFVSSVEHVAAGGLGDTAISTLLLQTAQLAAQFLSRSAARGPAAGVRPATEGPPAR